MTADLPDREQQKQRKGEQRVRAHRPGADGAHGPAEQVVDGGEGGARKPQPRDHGGHDRVEAAVMAQLVRQDRLEPLVGNSSAPEVTNSR